MIQEQTRYIISTRTFDAGRERLWKMYANPDHLATWRWPKDFRNTFYECDFRPGGNRHFMMHGPDGIEYENKSVFREIVYPERIIFDHFAPEFQTQIDFLDKDGKTELVWRMIFPSEALYTNIKRIAKPANEENFDRLATLMMKIGLLKS